MDDHHHHSENSEDEEGSNHNFESNDDTSFSEKICSLSSDQDYNDLFEKGDGTGNVNGMSL